MQLYERATGAPCYHAYCDVTPWGRVCTRKPRGVVIASYMTAFVSEGQSEVNRGSHGFSPSLCWQRSPALCLPLLRIFWYTCCVTVPASPVRYGEWTYVEPRRPIVVRGK